MTEPRRLIVTGCAGTTVPARHSVGLALTTGDGPVVLVLDEVTAFAVELALRTRVRAPVAFDLPTPSPPETSR